MRSVLLLGVTALCLCALVAADGEKSTPEKDGVLQLKKGNFNKSLREHEQLLVYLYAPLSGDSRRVLAAFEDAAAELQGSEVKLAVVDVSKEKDLAKELSASGVSAVRLYLSGDRHNPIDCPGCWKILERTFDGEIKEAWNVRLPTDDLDSVPQSSASILTWLKRREGSAADLIANLSQSETSEELTVVGFFKDLEHDYVQVFYAAAIDLPDVNFAVTQDDGVISKYGLTHDDVLLLKKSKLIQAYKMMPQTSKEDLIVFITVYQMDPVTEYTGKTATQILASPVLDHALLFVNKSSADFKEIHAAFNDAAETFRLRILFVWVNVDEPRNGRLMEYFRVRPFEAPLIRLVNLTNHVTYHLPSDTLDVETIQRFCLSYLNGTAKPKMQSEPIPEGWDQQPVKELVGMTLEKVAFNPNKTVFVLFYLPYSRESRSVFPLWEELAEALKEREDVVVARIDASANDIDMSMQGSHPSLCLFPALYAERVVVYSGKRKLKNLIKFLDKEMEKAKKDRVMEDEDRRKYVEAMKAEDAEKANNTKDEL